jgi:uncharacterized membrane protein YvlD (DUF360 family)
VARPSLGRLALRIALVWAIEAGALYLLAAIFSDVEIRGLRGAVSAVAVIGLLNAVLWPLLTRFAIRLFFWTLGFAALVLNGIFVVIAGDVLPGFHVDGVASGIVVALVLTTANAAVSALLAIDDEHSFFGGVVLRAARRAEDVERTDEPGVLFLEIDGLSIDSLRRALRDGHLPTLSRWLSDGTHRLVPWECDLSSQTGASQAGLLHGRNFDMPAFRWYERDSDRIVVSNHPRDAAEIEARISNGDGLLAEGGASRGNLFSGDAPRSLFTLSQGMKGRRTEDVYSFFADPYSFTRTLALSIADIALELAAAARQRRRNVRPRVARGGVYPLLRATTTVVLRDFNVYTLIGDMYRGVPVAYSTFVGYDEVAHHSGVERADALEVLVRLDRQFARIEAAAREAPRPYRLVVLSDHGQSQGATFLQRYGETLEEVVQRGMAADDDVAAPPAADESWGHLSAAATEIARQERGLLARLTRALTHKRRDGDAIALGPEAQRAAEPEGDEDSEAIVLASGNLGLVYLRDRAHRLSYEDLRIAHPELVSTLVEHPGIAFVLVHAEDQGGLVIGAGGTHRLADGHVDGEDPLRDFGPNAAAHVARTDGFPHVPDILVNGIYDPVTDEVAAFEELVGSHGGLGGAQARPFALIPSEWSEPAEPVVGAEAMHRRLRGWLTEARSATRPGSR